MKKLTVILLALVLMLAFAFTGCEDIIYDGSTDSEIAGSGETSDNEGDNSGEASDGTSSDGQGSQGGEEVPEIIRANTLSDKWKDDGVLKILLIGNSFTEDTAEFAWEIAKSLGIENVVIGILVIGGCSLNRHYESAIENIPDYSYRVKSEGKWVIKSQYIMSDALKADNWDAITIQQVSGLSGIAKSYGVLDKFIDFIVEKCPDAEIVWNCTWSYEDYAQLDDFARYFRDQLVMYNAICNVAQTVVEKNSRIALIAPTGTAVQNARTAIGSDVSRDGHHLSYTGRYLAALTYIHKITGLDISKVEFSAGLPEATKQICIQAAVNAVASPYSITAIN